MKKYNNIYNLVNRLTDDPGFRAFFTAYLIAETEAEREILSDRFWREVDLQNLADQQLIRAEFTRCFLKLPGLVADLYARTAANTATAA